MIGTSVGRTADGRDLLMDWFMYFHRFVLLFIESERRKKKYIGFVVFIVGSYSIHILEEWVHRILCAEIFPMYVDVQIIIIIHISLLICL